MTLVFKRYVFSRLFGSYLKIIMIYYLVLLLEIVDHREIIISDIVIGCLLEQGINVYDLGIVPTPVLFRESRKYCGSLMITASHNPLEWNGLKLLVKGRGLFEEELNLLLKTTIHGSAKYWRILQN